MRKVKSKNPGYVKRLTLFIDFMGFKEHVDRTVREPAFLSSLIGAMDRIAKIGDGNQAFHKSQRVTQFSDSVVVSYKVTEESAVFWLLTEIALCVIDLVERGFLVRGALTVGDLYHSKKYLVGPAMVEAYLLESTVAKYPRVLIEEKVLDVAKGARKDGHSEEEELGYVRDFMTRDADGQYFFDYVTWRSVVAIVGGDNDLYGAYLQNLATLIEKGFEHDHPKVLECYLWLHQQYADARQHVVDLPADHPYRLANPELCTDIADLPSLNRLAEVAQEKVAAGAAKRR